MSIFRFFFYMFLHFVIGGDACDSMAEDRRREIPFQNLCCPDNQNG
jgi:hypothetical protein